VLVLARTRDPATGRSVLSSRRTTCLPRYMERSAYLLTARGTATDDTAAFSVTDRNYLSARWPGDAYLFGRRFCELLQPAAQADR
jgi:putative intracellular protease/amidase